MTYAEKLKDPRWQKRRLEVLESAGWKCSSCERSDATLHVHHRRYVGGREPWEYEDDELESLCEHCHRRVTESKRRLISLLDGLGDDSLDTLVGLAWYLANDDRVDLEVDTYGVAEGVACGLRMARGRGWATAEWVMDRFPSSMSPGALGCEISHQEALCQEKP
jgi:hypothetical protein